MSNLLFAFSGIDGAGKSTQIELACQQLREAKKKYVYLWTRGGNTPGVAFLKSALRKLSPVRLPPPGRSSERDRLLAKPRVQTLWIYLAILELYWIYGIYIRWQLMIGRIVLCDRYLEDTLIDFTIMFPKRDVGAWFFWRGLKTIAPSPRASFFLKIPLDTSFERCNSKFEPFPDTEEEKVKRYELYLSHFNDLDYVVIDGTRSASILSREIVGVIDGEK